MVACGAVCKYRSTFYYKVNNMKLLLYTTKSAENVINKDKTLDAELDIKFKDRNDFIKPTILLKYDGKIKSNYAYLDYYDRYYFIENIDVFPNGIYQLYLRCDVLESFKNDILSSYGTIVQQENSNPYYNTEYLFEIRKEVEICRADVELEETQNTIMVAIGG